VCGGQVRDYPKIVEKLKGHLSKWQAAEKRVWMLGQVARPLAPPSPPHCSPSLPAWASALAKSLLPPLASSYHMQMRGACGAVVAARHRCRWMRLACMGVGVDVRVGGGMLARAHVRVQMSKVEWSDLNGVISGREVVCLVRAAKLPGARACVCMGVCVSVCAGVCVGVA